MSNISGMDLQDESKPFLWMSLFVSRWMKANRPLGKPRRPLAETSSSLPAAPELAFLKRSQDDSSQWGHKTEPKNWNRFFSKKHHSRKKSLSTQRKARAATCRPVCPVVGCLIICTKWHTLAYCMILRLVEIMTLMLIEWLLLIAESLPVRGWIWRWWCQREVWLVMGLWRYSPWWKDRDESPPFCCSLSLSPPAAPHPITPPSLPLSLPPLSPSLSVSRRFVRRETGHSIKILLLSPLLPLYGKWRIERRCENIISFFLFFCPSCLFSPSPSNGNRKWVDSPPMMGLLHSSQRHL